MAGARMLEGYRVLDLGQYLAGAGITRMLAELGPEIVKVELAPAGDPSRALPWIVDGRSTVFIQNNRGKRSVCVDWDTPGGRQVVEDLVTQCDVVVENFGPGVLRRRHLDYEHLRRLRPDLVMISISAFGQTGPWSDRPGFDGVIQAASGLMHMTGEPDGPPGSVAFAIADNTTAVHGFAALGYALLHRERTGEGQHVDIAMVDVMFHLQDQLGQHVASGGAFRPRRVGRHHPMYCPVGTYDLPEGYGFLLVLERQWWNLVRAMDRPDLGDDPRFADNAARAAHQAELIPIVQQWLLSFPDNETLVAHCTRHRVPLAPVLEPTEAIGHPHFESRRMVRRVKDPIAGEVVIPGYPWKFSAQPDLADLEAPVLGQHNEAVLGDVLGYDAERIARLYAEGALHRGDR
jgi:crotonobetainyl-CoA:carnitine CoA-transferase CaiB-like acyl-CoA transferase